MRAGTAQTASGLLRTSRTCWRLRGMSSGESARAVQDSTQQAFFNMSRTMSRGKIGPAPSFLNWSQALFSISTHAAATSACLSDARLRSLISARGDCSLGNPLLRLRLPRRNDSLWTRVAPAALARRYEQDMKMLEAPPACISAD